MGKAEDLAAKITTKAAHALSGLDREMAIMQWPADFRRIMWEAVAELAMSRAHEQKVKP